MKLTKRLVALLLLCAWSSPSHAATVIIGNLPAPNDGAGATVDAGIDANLSNFLNIHWAASFTMPAASYPVTNVALRLLNYDTAAGDVATVAIFSDNGSDLPGSVVGSPLISPPSSNTDLGTFNFAPAAPLILGAATKYWLVVDALAGEYQWQGASPAITPTSQVGANFGKQLLFEGAVTQDSSLRLSFEIVTGVPEPSTDCLLLFAFALAVVTLRKPFGRA